MDAKPKLVLVDDYFKPETEAPALTEHKKIILEFFPSEYLVLQKEVFSEFHPKLHAILSRIKAEDLDMKLGHIASYCEVILDGEYTLEERMKLCVILTEKLMLKREEPKAQVILEL